MTRAIEEVLPRTLRQRCLVRKKQNLLAKVPETEQPAMRAFLNAVYPGAVPRRCARAGERVGHEVRRRVPVGGPLLSRRPGPCLQQLRCTEVHRKAIRTTNVIERAFEELRRRPKVIPRFFDERSCLRLAYAELIRAGQRSQRVRMSEI